jgi:hypothetical protein
MCDVCACLLTVVGCVYVCLYEVVRRGREEREERGGKRRERAKGTVSQKK